MMAIGIGFTKEMHENNQKKNFDQYQKEYPID